MAEHEKSDTRPHVSLLYLVDSKSEVEDAKTLLSEFVSIFKDRGIEADPVVRVAPTTLIAEEINKLKPEVVFLVKSKLTSKIRASVMGIIVNYPAPNRRMVAFTVVLAMASITWYYLLFTDLDIINRYILAKKFYSGILVAAMLVITVMIYGTFIGNVLRFMGLDTKSTH